LEELVAGLLRPRLFPFGKLSKAKSAAHICILHIVDLEKFLFLKTVNLIESLLKHMVL
jgi:hypothetical protein